MWSWRAFFVVALLAAMHAPAWAHKLAPSLLSLVEQADGRYVVSWKTPRLASTPVLIEPVLPHGCRDLGERSSGY